MNGLRKEGGKRIFDPALPKTVTSRFFVTYPAVVRCEADQPIFTKQTVAVQLLILPTGQSCQKDLGYTHYSIRFLGRHL